MNEQTQHETRFADPSVAVYDCGRANYPQRPPFDPPARYPEYPFAPDRLDEDNYVYHAVRELFKLLGLDVEHCGQAEWNPLGAIIKPGDAVVLKPNLVISEHPDGLAGIQASVVHGSIVRAFLDYVLIANGGLGRISVVDSPIKEVDFDRILDLTGIGQTVTYLNQSQGLNIELVDLRDLQVQRNSNRVMVNSQRLTGDPLGYRVIDLGRESQLDEIARHAARYRSTAAVYENSIVQAHNRDHNLYSIPERILQADTVISLAKLKTHRKAGVTLSLKNMVGLTNEKRWLPHHRVGTPRSGGDLCADNTRPDVQFQERAKDLLITHSWGRWVAQYMGIPTLAFYQRYLKRFADRGFPVGEYSHVEDGDWYGNDTIWRTIVDLNTLLFYADREGVLRDTPQRRYFSVIDGIIAGGGEGPLKPTPYEAGLLVGGFNPVAVDIVCSRLMGYDFRSIPQITGASCSPATAPE